MSAYKYEKDPENIVTVTLSDSATPVGNDGIYNQTKEVVARLEKDDIAGVILCLGSDSNQAPVTFTGKTRQEVYEELASFKSSLRRLENLGKPVVAAISNYAIGPEFEISLAGHYRIAVNKPDISIGLPNDAAGALRRIGGLARLVHVAGLEKALALLQEGTSLQPEKALETGLLNELATSQEDLILKAKAWIKANPEAVQPWDQKGYRLPGGATDHPRIAGMIMAAPALLRKKFPERNLLQESILSAAVESARVDIESALRIESRYLVELLFARERG